MSAATQTYATLFKLAVSSREAEMVKQAVRGAMPPLQRLMQLIKNPKVAWGLAGTGLAGAGIGIPIVYSAGERAAEEGATQTKNLAFGAGLLSGLFGPTLLRGVGQLIGLSPGAGLEEFEEI